MILVIDNYDSFTYNIVQCLQVLTAEEVRVVRSKETTVQELIALNPSRVILSPGPGRPEDAGVTVEAIKAFSHKVPILGVCLGHQAIGYAFGASIKRAKFIKHGVAEEINLDGKGVFRFLPLRSTFTRYHSLAVDKSTLPKDFEVTAYSDDGEVMGIRHKTLPIEGVQFHPESIASQGGFLETGVVSSSSVTSSAAGGGGMPEGGKKLFKAFLNYRRERLDTRAILTKLTNGKSLTRDEAALFMEDLTEGAMDERVTAAVLTAITIKGPSADELAGTAGVLCKKMTALPACAATARQAKQLGGFSPALPVDGTNLCEIVGTGGDGKGSFNISSMAALICSACGVAVAKHGNRAVSSKSGAADFYEALGIKIDLPPEKMARLIKTCGFGFLMAPLYHKAMRFAGPVRKALGIKTLMNVIGPLSNPARAAYEVLGVYSMDLLESVARAAKALGVKRVMTVYSEDGYDEISPCAKTHAVQINEDGVLHRYVINPVNMDFGTMDEKELMGGDGTENAALARSIMAGGGRRTIRAAVALNAGALLYLSGKTRTIKEGTLMALAALDYGSVKRKADEIAAASNRE